MSTHHGVEYEEHIRALLAAIRQGDRAAFETLIEGIRHDMRRLSGYIISSRPPLESMQATALVNEAVLRLVQMLNRKSQNFPETKEHLMNLLSQMMRFTLTDHARKRRIATESLDAPARDENGEASQVTGMEMLRDWSVHDLDLLLSVDHVLDRMERSDRDYGERRRRATELHLFSGLNFREISDELGVSEDVARRDCLIALARLREALQSTADA